MNLRRHVVRTPLLAYRSGDPDLAGRIFLKPENLQPFGSYKIRGVAAAIEAASPALLREGLSAASAGNMGQAVAFAAGVVGAPCRIFVPDTAPDIKKQAIRRLGAALEELPFSQIWAAVRGDIELEPRGLFIHPARTPALLQGYASIAEEIVADLPDVDALVVPYGLGGLALGVTRAIKALKPDVAVFSVEPETAAPMAASLVAGHSVAVERRPSFVDAIGTPEVLPGVFEELQSQLAGGLVVSISDAEAAVAELFRSQRMVVEGAGACAFAAARSLAAQGEHRAIAAILTGANLGEDTLLDILARHPAA